MSNLPEYKVVQSFSSESIGKDVTDLLVQGWQLYGPLVVLVSAGGSTTYLQPVTLNLKRPPAYRSADTE